MLQERDLELELGDDYILDLQSELASLLMEELVKTVGSRPGGVFRILGSDERGREAGQDSGGVGGTQHCGLHRSGYHEGEC